MNSIATHNENTATIEVKNGKKRKDNSTISSQHIMHSKRHSNRSNEVGKNSRNQTKRVISIYKPVLTPLEKITEVESLRNKLNEEYTKITSKTYLKQKRLIISKWKNVLELLQNLDAKLFLVALKCLTDIYIEFDEFEIAKNYCFYYKFFANFLEFPEEVLVSYETLGTIYKFLFQYNKAIKCYKKQIEIAWVLGDKHSELRAFDNIGIQYFYLGNRDKAKYYHERMLYGRAEGKTELKESVSKVFKNKNFHIFHEDKYIKNTKTNDELKEKLR